MQVVSFQSSSIVSYSQLPFSCLQERELFPGCPCYLLECCCYGLVLCSFKCFWLFHPSKTTATFSLTVFIICLSQLSWHSFWMPISEQFLMSASISHQNNTPKRMPLNFQLTQGLQRCSVSYPEVLLLAVYKYHTKNFLLLFPMHSWDTRLMIHCRYCVANR